MGSGGSTEIKAVVYYNGQETTIHWDSQRDIIVTRPPEFKAVLDEADDGGLNMRIESVWVHVENIIPSADVVTMPIPSIVFAIAKARAKSINTLAISGHAHPETVLFFFFDHATPTIKMLHNIHTILNTMEFVICDMHHREFSRPYYTRYLHSQETGFYSEGQYPLEQSKVIK